MYLGELMKQNHAWSL